MLSLNVIVTGGTIDKQYDPHIGSMGHSVSLVSQMLSNGRCSVPYRVTELFLRDSLEITNEERTAIVNACEASPEESIIVVHGTDTMIETARRLSYIPNKTIVTVGAFIPYSVNNSDAEFNLGAAIAYSQCLPFGSYVSMNGVIYHHSSVRKDYEHQRFTSI